MFFTNNSTMKRISQIITAVYRTLGSVFEVFTDYFVTDTELMSPEIKKIMSNPNDKTVYLNAIKELKVGEKKVVDIKLSDKKNMKLTLNN